MFGLIFRRILYIYIYIYIYQGKENLLIIEQISQVGPT